jgi:hypothetical protein
MEKSIKILLVLGVLITIALAFINIYLAGIVCIILITILMSLQIMQDTRGIPDITVKFSPDAKGIILTNAGNARAVKIHGALVPGNIEFDVPFIDPDLSYDFTFDRMVEEIKVVITYSNEDNRTFSLSSKLSVFDEESDPLKPMIPIFRWKK